MYRRQEEPLSEGLRCQQNWKVVKRGRIAVYKVTKELLCVCACFVRDWLIAKQTRGKGEKDN
jgi:hypothetical protein